MEGLDNDSSGLRRFGPKVKRQEISSRFQSPESIVDDTNR